MTGYGRSSRVTELGEASIEIKTVNHRFLEVRTRVPSELSSMEIHLDKIVRDHLKRGYCTVHLSIEIGQNNSNTINEEVLNEHIDVLKNVSKAHQIPIESLLPLVGNAPNLFETQSTTLTQNIEKIVKDVCVDAVLAVTSMRLQEGQNMAKDIEQKLASILELKEEIGKLAQNQEKSIFEKYKQKIETFADDSADAPRIETEAAIFAEKADINEEITRIQSHIEQFKTLFNSKFPIGRKMEFLVQELAREANTIASKSASSSITHLVVNIKSELEKIREMVQNVE